VPLNYNLRMKMGLVCGWPVFGPTMPPSANHPFPIIFLLFRTPAFSGHEKLSLIAWRYQSQQESSTCCESNDKPINLITDVPPNSARLWCPLPYMGHRFAGNCTRLSGAAKTYRSLNSWRNVQESEASIPSCKFKIATHGSEQMNTVGE